MSRNIKISIGIVLLLIAAIGVVYFVSINKPQNDSIIVDIIDRTKTEDIACAEALEKFYEDDENEYYFPCIKSQYIIVKYKDNNEENIKIAFENSNVTLADLDRFEIQYYKESKEKTEEKHSFIATVLEETTTYMMVEPAEGSNERKSADKIIVNYGVDHKDYLYGVGKKVIVYYDGNIAETYPAQINSNEIDIDGYDDFKIIVKEAANVEKKKILNNKELYELNSDYDLYYYGLDEVNVKVEEKEMTLEEALRNGYITLGGIISKANRDVEEVQDKYEQLEKWQSSPKLFPYSSQANDGGTIKYHYQNYTIIKCHTLGGNRDVYIGNISMTLDTII